MNHDPLCPNAELFHMRPTSICLYCYVIRNARKDENSVRVNALAHLTKAATEKGYNAALRDAQDAIESAWTEDPSWDGTNWNNALSAAKEAIEALGGAE